jgi:deoxyhypusine monooxygenase
MSPSPSPSPSSHISISSVGSVLNDRRRPLKERFRALFTLKNLGGEEAVGEMERCFEDPSALLKHEVNKNNYDTS